MPMPLCWLSSTATPCRLVNTITAHTRTTMVHCRCTRPAQRRTRWPVPSSCHTVTRRTTATTTADPGIDKMR